MKLKFKALINFDVPVITVPLYHEMQEEQRKAKYPLLDNVKIIAMIEALDYKLHVTKTSSESQATTFER
jgi:hypothetical protein